MGDPKARELAVGFLGESLRCMVLC